MQTNIWVEKYRPQALAEVVFRDERQRQQFAAIAESGDLPNLLLYGGQGTGKTTVSRALVRELGVDQLDVLTINCSDEKIEALRDKVRGFALSYPAGSFRVVRLEEIDYLSLDGQALLRGLIEEAARNCRFIATCNYVNRVIPPLRSRFQEFEFRAPDQEQLTLRSADILEQEGVQFDPEVLVDYVAAGYPDFRKVIQLLQQHSAGKKLARATAAETASDWKLGLLECLQRGDWQKARKLVCESATREEHEDVYRFLYENLARVFKKSEDIDEAIIIIADHLRDHSLVADTEINLAACFIRLRQLQITGYK